jgi:hypothetical protein
VGTTMPAAPAAAAVPRKLLLEIPDFFMVSLCMCQSYNFILSVVWSEGLMSEGLMSEGQ